MTITDLTNQVRFVTDAEGNRQAVQLDLAVWEEIVAIIEELEAEQRWDELFVNSQDALIELGREALQEHHQGLTEPLDPDTL